MNNSLINSKPKKAVVYLRVSTEEQVDNFSLGTQEELCKKKALTDGYEIIETFREEGKSAKTITGRPELVRMLEYCRKNKKSISAVLVYRVDRLSRLASDYLAIRKKLNDCDIMLISVSEPTGNSPTEKLMETIFAGIAQLDNDVRSERTSNGMRARFLSGLHTGIPPLGYKNENGYIVKDSETFDKIQKAWELMATGSKTLREIANIMNYWGIREKRFKGQAYPLRSQSVSRLFRNKFYMGILTSATYPEEVMGQHVPMVTKEQFYRVQAIIDGRNTNITAPLNKKNKDNTDFPLRRIVSCGKCGMAMTGAWSKHHSYAYYFCRARCKSSNNVPPAIMEEALVKFLREITPTMECLKLFIALLRRDYMKRVEILRRQKAAADVELTKLYEQRQGIIEKNLGGVYSDEIFKEQNALIEEKIIRARMTKDDTLVKRYNLEELVKFIEQFFADLGKTYLNASLTQKRALLSSIFASKLAWSYPGYSNCQISPIYQAIRDFPNSSAPVGDPKGIRTPDYRDENPVS